MYAPSYDRDGMPRPGPRRAGMMNPDRVAGSACGVSFVPCDLERSERSLADDGFDRGEWHVFQPSDAVALRVLGRLALASDLADRSRTRLAFDRVDYASGLATHAQMERVRAARPDRKTT